MTTITLPRATVEQAADELEKTIVRTEARQATINNLRAALAQQAEPRNQCRSDGRCQYAIDHGAEGIGHCPKGKCVMAQHTQPAEDRDVAQSNLRVMKEMFREQTEPAQQAEPTPPDATAGLVDDLCLLHMGWKADAEGDLYRAAWGRVIARAKQLKAQVGKGEEK